jgi:predicted MFS family arabinose efflux permease
VSGPPAPETTQPVRAAAGAALSTVLGALPVFLLGGLAVLVRDDLEFGEVGLGLAVTVFFAVSALSSVPAGGVAERLGARTTTITAAGLSAAALLGVALVVTSYAGLLVALALAGVANALAQIGSNAALAHHVPRRRQGLAFGVKQAAVPAATLLAGLALPLVGLTLGWRFAFGGAAVLALVFLAVAPSAAEPRRSREQRRQGRGGDAALRALVVVAVGASLGSAAANSLGTFLVEWAVTDGVAPGRAGLLLAGGSTLGVLVRLGVGWQADSRGGRHLPVVAGMLAGGAAGMVLISLGGTVGLVAGAALAFGLGWSWPGLLNFAVVRLNPTAPALATSVTQAGVFAGGAFGPLAFGLAVDATSYSVAWTGAAVSLLSASGLVLVGRRMLVADRERREAAEVPAEGVPPSGGG